MPGILLVPLVVPLTEGLRNVRFGRIKVVTIKEAIAELVGGTVEQVGEYVTVGDRKPKAFAPILPLFGSAADSNPYASGMRMRRQVRSLLGNADARHGGIYFKFDIDPELNGWIVCGGVEIKYGQGGITFANFDAALQDSYLLGTQRTHQRAMRLEVYDLRSASTARDYLKQLYSTAFSGYGVLNAHWLPSNVSGVVDENGVPVPDTFAATTIDGNVLYVPNRADGEVLRFEQAETDMPSSAVLILDRQGFTAPTYTLAGDAAPQDTYAWEEVYGPDHPLTAADVPVLQNGLCRLRRVPGATFAFALDEYVAGTGYVERGRIACYDAQNSTYYQLVRASVVEWTEERAVLLLQASQADESAAIYITLQRGWIGPRFEIYANRASGSIAPALHYSPFSSAAQTLTSQAGSQAGAGSLALGTEPWITLKPGSGSGPGMSAGVIKVVSLVTFDSSLLYGSNRRSFSIYASGATPGYVSVAYAPSSDGSPGYNTKAQWNASSQFILTRCIPTLFKR